jgi:hypothetical protein
MIRPDDGMVRLAPDMGWVDQAFGAELGRALGRDLDAGRGPIHATLLDAAISLLSATPGCESPERSAALDLLAADALVTYAFEMDAEVPEEIDSLADSAMRELGALAPEGST